MTAHRGPLDDERNRLTWGERVRLSVVRPTPYLDEPDDSRDDGYRIPTEEPDPYWPLGLGRAIGRFKVMTAAELDAELRAVWERPILSDLRASEENRLADEDYWKQKEAE